jgi:hypothetical protein
MVQNGNSSWGLWDTLGCSLWVVVLSITIYTNDKHGGGTLAIILSLLAAMYMFGFREKWTSEEVSVFSVLNKNQHAIPGSLTAQQFDSQLRGDNRPHHEEEAGASMGKETSRSSQWCQGHARKLVETDDTKDHTSTSVLALSSASSAAAAEPCPSLSSTGSREQEQRQRRDLVRAAALKRMAHSTTPVSNTASSSTH